MLFPDQSCSPDKNEEKNMPNNVDNAVVFFSNEVNPSMQETFFELETRCRQSNSCVNEIQLPAGNQASRFTEKDGRLWAISRETQRK